MQGEGTNNEPLHFFGISHDQFTNASFRDNLPNKSTQFAGRKSLSKSPMQFFKGKSLNNPPKRVVEISHEQFTKASWRDKLLNSQM